MEDVHDVFACRTLRPQVLPVVGNHDLKAENAAFIRQDMLAAVPGLIKRQADACDYYYDFKNVRLIMRVSDPKGAAANNASVFPDEPDGIYQIDAGATGHAASNTFVRVQIDGKQVSARAYAAQNGTNQAFTVIDRWQF